MIQCKFNYITRENFLICDQKYNKLDKSISTAIVYIYIYI